MFRSKALIAVVVGAVSWLGAGDAIAQRPFVSEWPGGMVVLHSGDTVRGPVTYFRAEELIQVEMPDGRLSAFAPVNVHSFLVVSKDRRYRQYFRTHMWNRGRDYSDFLVPGFFEQITREGQYSLVKRESMSRREAGQSLMASGRGGMMNPYGGGGMMRPAPIFVDEVKEHFFLLTPEGKVITLRKPKKDLLHAFHDKSRQVKAYMKQNKLVGNSGQDLVKVVQYYNSLH